MDWKVNVGGKFLAVTVNNNTRVELIDLMREQSSVGGYAHLTIGEGDSESHIWWTPGVPVFFEPARGGEAGADANYVFA